MSLPVQPINKTRIQPWRWSGQRTDSCARNWRSYRRMLGIEGRSSIFEILMGFGGVLRGGFQSKRFEAQSA